MANDRLGIPSNWPTPFASVLFFLNINNQPSTINSFSSASLGGLCGILSRRSARRRHLVPAKRSGDGWRFTLFPGSLALRRIVAATCVSRVLFVGRLRSLLPAPSPARLRWRSLLLFVQRWKFDVGRLRSPLPRAVTGAPTMALSLPLRSTLEVRCWTLDVCVPLSPAPSPARLRWRSLFLFVQRWKFDFGCWMFAFPSPPRRHRRAYDGAYDGARGVTGALGRGECAEVVEGFGDAVFEGADVAEAGGEEFLDGGAGVFDIAGAGIEMADG